MYVPPKQRVQSKPPLLQKSVVVSLDSDAEAGLSGTADCVRLSELVDVVDASISDDGVEVSLSGPDDEQVSSPYRLSPGL